MSVEFFTAQIGNSNTRRVPVLIGSGNTILDGVIRLDVARALAGSRGWRVDLYFELR